MSTEATPPMNYPREQGSPVGPFPLTNEGPDPFFPAVCLKTHWDPTTILRRTLPSGYVAQPLDPRPWAKICMEYTTTGDAQPAPATPDSVVMPSGGQFYPPDKYQRAIDAESQLRRLDRPLGTCEADQWEPTLRSDMFNARILVPDRAAPSDPARIQEVAYPKALLRSGPYPCREEADKINTAMTSDFVFNNATKQDRYKLMGKTTKATPPSESLRAADEFARTGQRASMYTAGSYGQQAANLRADLVAAAVDTKFQAAAKAEEGILTPDINGRILPIVASSANYQNLQLR